MYRAKIARSISLKEVYKRCRENWREWIRFKIIHSGNQLEFYNFIDDYRVILKENGELSCEARNLREAKMRIYFITRNLRKDGFLIQEEPSII